MKDKTFRISAKRLFLTFSQLPEDLTKQDIIEKLTAKLRFDFYLIGQEKHQDQAKHFHVLLEKNTKFDIRNYTDLDIQVENHNFHGNCQKAKNYKHIASYIIKDANYIHNYPNFVNGKFLPFAEDMIRVARDIEIKEGVQYFIKTYPKKALGGMNAALVQLD